MTGTVVGLRPALPGWLRRLPGLDGVVPAERLIALRIVVGVTLLIDLLIGYLPHLDVWRAVLADAPFAERIAWPHWRWSITPAVGIGGTIAIGISGALGLAFGRAIRLSTVAAFAAAISLTNDDPMTTNGGDLMRSSALLILLATPAVRSPRTALGERVFIPSWFATILLLQLAMLYFMNGFYKVQSPAWRDGSVMAGILNDWNWSTVAGISPLIPAFVTRPMAWATLAWELSFPVVLFAPAWRWRWLAVGVLFHLGTIATLVVGFFPLYCLCLYVPFVPWERFRSMPAE
jgi:hypothetical protein